MLLSFKSHELYFETIIAHIFKIIITTPQFNNRRDVDELCDIYFRKIASYNLAFSSKVCADCFHMVEFLFDQGEIANIVSTFDDYRNAYHYLAIIAHMRRVEKKYGLLTMFPHMHYNICKVHEFNKMRGF